MIGRFSLKKSCLIIALAVIGCLSLLGGTLMLCLGGRPHDSVSAADEEPAATAAPYRDYTALDVITPDDYTGVYVGITTARGLKNMLNVRGTINPEGNFTESETYTLAYGEYVLAYGDGTVIPDGVLLTENRPDNDSLSLLVSSGSAVRDVYVKVASEEDTPDTETITSVTVTGVSAITDDHTEDTIAKIPELTVSDQDGNVLRSDMYEIINLVYAGSTATFNVRVRGQGNSYITESVTVKVTAAQLIGVDLRPGAGLILEGLYYKTFAKDADGKEVKIDAFVKGATPEQIFENLTVSAVYENSRKQLVLAYNEQHQLSEATYNGQSFPISTNTTQSNEEQNRTVTVTIGAYTASISINFADVSVVGVKIDKTAFDNVLDGYGTLNSYTRLLKENFVSAVTLTMNDGSQRPAVAGDIDFIGSLAPTAKIIKDYEDSSNQSAFTYTKTITVRSVDNPEAKDEAKVAGISYSTPIAIARTISDVDSSTYMPTQVMHHNFDYSGLSVTLYYADEDGEEFETTLNLSDFYVEDDATLTNRFLKTVITDKNGVTEDKISVKTQRVEVQFTYGTLKTSAKIGIVGDANRPLNVVKDPVNAPVINTNTETYKEGLTKDIDVNQLVYGDSLGMTVGIYNNAECVGGEVSDEYVSYADGKISFKSGGTFYVKIALGTDEVSQKEYNLVSSVTSSNITADPEGRFVVYRITVNKGTIAVNLKSIAGDIYYGDDINPTVTGTVGGRTYTLTSDAVSEGDNERICVPYKIVYIKSGETYDPVNYDYESYNEPAEIDAGSYTLYAITKSTNAYLASKTRAGNGISVVVKKRILTLGDDAVKIFTYDRTKRSASEFIDVTNANFATKYNHNAENVLDIITDGALFLHADTYPVTVEIKSDFRKNYTFADEKISLDVDFVIEKREHTFTASTNDFKYGNNAAPRFNFVKGDPSHFYAVIPDTPKYYKADAAGKPTGEEITDLTFSSWPVGNYVAVFETTLGESDLEGDYDLPSANAVFKITPVSVTKIEITEEGWATDLASAGIIGTYGATGTEAELKNWESIPGGNVAGGNGADKIVTVTVSAHRLAPDETTMVDGLENVQTDGIITLTEAGVYTVTISLNPNYVWKNSDGANDALVFYGTIGKQTVSDLGLSESFTYDGEAHNVNVTFSVGGGSAAWTDGIVFVDSVKGVSYGAEGDIATPAVQSGVFSVTNAGDYTVGLKLVSPLNYKWNDNAEGTTKNLTYTVNRAHFVVSWDGKSGATSLSYDFKEGGVAQTLPSYAPDVYAADNALISVSEYEIYTDAECTQPVENKEDGKSVVYSSGVYFIKITGFGANTGTQNAKVYKNYLPVEDENYSGEFLKNISVKFEIVSPEFEKPTLTVGGTAVTVEYKGSAYKFSDFINNYSDIYVGANGKMRLAITVDGIEGNPDIRDVKIADRGVAAYTVTVVPASDYKWTDGTQTAVTFTLTITKLAVTLGWDNVSHVYGNTAGATAEVANIPTGSGDIVTVSVVYRNDESGSSADIIPEDAGKYYSYAVSLSGKSADNYTLDGVSNRFNEYFVEKAQVAKPDLGDVFEGEYDGTSQSHMFNGYDKMTASVVGVRPLNWYKTSVEESARTFTEGCAFDAANGVFTFTNAGNYSVKFKLSDGKNYCWSGDDVRDYGKSEYTYSIADFAEISRKTLTAPALGAMRAMEQTNGYKEFTMFTGSCGGAEYSVLYGKRTGGGYVEESAYRADISPDDSSAVIRGQYYALLTITDSDYYNYLWTVEFDNADNDGFAGSAFIPGGVYFETVYATDGVKVYLYYAITASQVTITVSVNNQVEGKDGYIYGQNGYSVGVGIISDDEKITRDKLFTATPAAEFGDAEIANTSYGFYKANPDGTADGSKIAEADLVEGLPWEAGHYLVEFTIEFTDKEQFQDWTGTKEFTVVPRTVEIEWTFGGISVAEEIFTVYNGEGQLPEAIVVNAVKKYVDDKTAAPALKLNYTTENAPVDVAAVPYTVKVSAFADDENNYAIAEYGINLVITPKSLNVTGKNAEHVYGDLFGKYNISEAFDNRTYFSVAEEIYARDGQIILMEVRDGDNVVTAPLNALAGQNYEFVPVLGTANAKSANYVIENNVSGDFKVIKRIIEVSVNKDLATSVYGSQPVDLNADGMYSVTKKNGADDGILADNIFSLSVAGLSVTSPISSDAVDYPIICTTENANYTVNFVECDYIVTPAEITGEKVSVYKGTYDADNHNIFDVDAIAVNGQELHWFYKPASASDAEWAEYTITDGVANKTVRNVSDNLSYNIKVTAENHKDLVLDGIFTVGITKAVLTVRVGMEIFFGEYGPHNYDGTQTKYKTGLSDLRENGGIYTVTGFMGADEDLFYTGGDFYGISGTFTYRYAGNSVYERGGVCGDYVLECVIAGGQGITGVTCENYTFSGATDGILKVKPLPVIVEIDDYVATYNETDPQTPVVNIKTNQPSSYKGVDGVINYAVDNVNVVTISNPALSVHEEGVSTNNAGVYDITVTLNANYILDSNAADGGYKKATYTIRRAANSIVTENYELFTGVGLSAKDNAPDKSAWIYGNYSSAHLGGYNAEGSQALKALAMLCAENDLTVTLYRGNAIVGESLVIPAETVDATALIKQWFAELYAEKTFIASTYSIVYEMPQTTNYAEFVETWCFNVAQQKLTVKADDFSVEYGENIRTEGYTFSTDGLVANGDGAVDAIENVVAFEFGSSYEKGFENGSVKKNGYVISVNEGECGSLYDNYEIEFKEGKLTVTARKINIQIVDLENYFNLIKLDGTEYVTEETDNYRFKLLEGTFAAGDGNVTDNGETEADAQNVFNLVSDALTSPDGKNYATNNQGVYPIYLTAGAHYGADGANYDITVVNATYSGGNVPSGALAGGKAGTFVIKKAQLFMSIDGPFKDEECTEASKYAADDPDAFRYDGKSKYYKAQLDLPGNAEVRVSARYYVQGSYTEKDILGYVPVNAGLYRVWFVTDDDNYEPAQSYRDYGISKRTIENPVSGTANASGSDLIAGPDGGYYFNGFDYTYSMQFSNFVDGESLVLSTAEIKSLHKQIGIDREEFLAATYGVSTSDGRTYYRYTARNAGIYQVTVTLGDGEGGNGFLAANYQFDSNGALSRGFTLRILLETLTVSTAAATVQYGDDLTADSFSGFNALYFVRNVAAATAGSSANILLKAERDNGYLSLVGDKETFVTDYKVSDSKWGMRYDLYIDTACITAYNFNIVPDIPERNEDKPLGIVAREVTIAIYGIDSDRENTYAQCVYDGQNKNHNDCLSAALTANRGSFFSVISGELGVKPVGYVNPVNGAVLRIDPVVRNTGRYAMAPSYNTDMYAMYNVKFVNENGETVNNDLSSESNVNKLPKYEISKAELTVKVGLNGSAVSYDNINGNFTLPYGTALRLSGNDSTFTVRYSGWKNGEGNEIGNVSASGSVNLSGYTAQSTEGVEYAAWVSNYKDEFTVTSVFVGEYLNYNVKIITANMTVGQLTVSAVSEAVTYEEKKNGDKPVYNGGVSGAEREISLVFSGVEVALPDANSVVHNSEFVYSTVYETDSTNADVAGRAPTKAGSYRATVTLDANGNYKFAEGYSVTATHTVEKKQINLQWRPVSLMVTADEESRKGSVDAYVDDLMVVRMFNFHSNGTVRDIRGESYYTLSDNGLKITVPEIGRYELSVGFNSAAAVNYCWFEDETASVVTISLTAGISDKAVTLKVSVADRKFDEASAEPSYELINMAGETVTGAVIRFAYASVNAGEFGETSGALENTEQVIGLSYSVNAPVNAGWYVVRAEYGGSETYLAARAFWLFNISKATLDKPEFKVNGDVYTGSELTADIVYNTQVVFVSDFTGSSFRTGSDGSTLRETNAGTYKATVAIRSTAAANYEWLSTLAEDDDVEVTVDSEGNITSVVLTWNIAKATENSVVWNNSNIYRITYGGNYTISASSPYTESVIISYASAVDGAGNPVDADDVPESGWTTYRRSSAGIYYVRAVVNETDNYVGITDYKTLTIEKAELTAIPYGSLEYGTEFSDSVCGVNFSGFVNEDTGATIVTDKNLVKYFHNADELVVNDNGYKLLMETYDGSDGKEAGTVKGLTSPNYIIKLAANGGILRVLPKSVTVQIGNAKGYYREVADISETEIRILGDWDSSRPVSVLGIILSTTAQEDSAVGNYPITGTSSNKNYSVTFRNGTYTVEALKVRVGITAGGGEYGDVITPASVNRIYYIKNDTEYDLGADAMRFNFRYTGVSNGGISVNSASAPALAGTYLVTVTGIVDNSNYILDVTGNTSEKFEVSQKVLDISNLSIPSQRYTGKALTPVIVDDEYNTGDKKLYTVVTHEDFVNAGTYRVRLQLTDAYNYRWSSAGELRFTVTKALNSLVGEISIEGWTYGQYDANVNSPKAETMFDSGNIIFMYARTKDAQEESWSNAIPSNGDAGEYWVRVTVYGTENYERFDSAPVKFIVERVSVFAPTLELNVENSTYTGGELGAAIIGYMNGMMGITFSGIDSGSEGYVLKAVNAGTYIAKVWLRDSVNYCWAEGTVCDEEKNALLTWVIARKKVAFPSEDNRALVANGEIMQFIPDGFDETLMKIEGNEAGYGGTFTAYVSLLDTLNYEWEDGTTAAKAIVWTIIGANTVFVIVISVLSGASGIAGVTAAGLFIRYRKKKRLEEEVPFDDASVEMAEGGETV